MSKQELRVLTDQQVRILFEVWRNNNQSWGMTNKEIQAAVRKETEPQRGVSLSNIKKIIDQLEKLEPEPLLQPSRAGKNAKLHSLFKEQMITWPSSGHMLLLLAKAGTVERTHFIQRMHKLNMEDPDTSEPFTEQEIEIQIDYCRDRRVPYIEQDSKGFLKITDRVRRERAFLEKVALFTTFKATTERAR